MNRILLFLSIFFLTPFLSWAIEGISQSYVFYSPAKKGSDTAFVEIVWQLNPVSITYSPNGNFLESQLLVQTTISGPDQFSIQDAFIAATTPFSQGAASIPPVYFRQRYRLPDSGTYYLSLRVSEKDHPEHFVVFNDSVKVELEKKPRFSSIMLLDTTYAIQTPNPYTKAGKERIGRPLSFADSNQLSMDFYTELYHAPTPYAILQLSISRKQKGGSPNNLLRTDTIRTKEQRYPIAENFDLKSLPSGNYYLTTALFDTAGAPLSNQQLFFQLSNPYPVAEERSEWDSTALNTPLKFLDISKTFVGKYSDEERRAILKMILPVADVVETNNIAIMLQKGSDPLHTAYFIYNFFIKRNKEKPETAWKEYSAKVREVNKLFAETGRMGYETDRGRVYLKYGAADERLKVPAESGALPYEIWRYDYNPLIPQQSFFLFYQDGYTIGEYRLLHSTVTDEPYNARWGEILFKGNTEKLKNSRAWRLMNNE